MSKLAFTFLITITLTLVLLANPLQAQDSPEDRRKEIDRLMEVTGMLKVADQVRDQLLTVMKTQHPEVSDEYLEAFRKNFNAADLIDRIRPLYAKYYTVEDLRALIAFYESPVGKKVLTTMPQLMGDVMQISEDWSTRILEDAEKEMTNKKGDKKTDPKGEKKGSKKSDKKSK